MCTLSCFSLSLSFSFSLYFLDNRGNVHIHIAPCMGSMLPFATFLPPPTVDSFHSNQFNSYWDESGIICSTYTQQLHLQWKKDFTLTTTRLHMWTRQAVLSLSFFTGLFLFADCNSLPFHLKSDRNIFTLLFSFSHILLRCFSLSLSLSLSFYPCTCTEGTRRQANYNCTQVRTRKWIQWLGFEITPTLNSFFSVERKTQGERERERERGRRRLASILTLPVNPWSKCCHTGGQNGW